ncbi:hypothetical protein GY45DRAFT_1318051 [Cubamyces sp. BRFM 1775]|nr:hypothetical protein GY45DRAFT_1318051 [Cubamyces sp. BRFM 1775]
MSPATVAGHNIDPASRIDPKHHQPQVVRMVKTPVTYGVIDYFINTVAFMVTCILYGVVDKRVAKVKTTATVKILTDFIDNAGLGTATILVALVYLQRIEHDLQIDESAWVCERLAVGALMVAYKYTNDLPVKAELWARCTRVFSKTDVMRIEREFLALLNFEVRVSDADLLALYDEFMATVYPYGDGASTRALFEHRERDVYHYPIQPHDSPSLHLPDLVYPDSPADSEDTPPIVTPPDASAPWLPKMAATATRNPYLAPHLPSAPVATQPTARRGDIDAARMDTEMEARLRWYSVVDESSSPAPASSPRFEPFSPPSMRYAAQSAPWRSYSWPSGTRDDVWGHEGLTIKI